MVQRRCLPGPALYSVNNRETSLGADPFEGSRMALRRPPLGSIFYFESQLDRQLPSEPKNLIRFMYAQVLGVINGKGILVKFLAVVDEAIHTHFLDTW